MPLIPYPDIPQLPGVPAIPRSPNVSTPNISNVTPNSIPVNNYGVQWGFVFNNGLVPLTPDSFIEFEYREERKIPNYPVEGGSFASYNKVALPFDVRVTVSCNGNGSMTKENFLNTIEELINSLDLINVVTPNKTYNNCNLIHVDYRREARQGVSLIVAQLWFQEVRISQTGTVTTTSPSAAPVQNVGQVSPVAPTKPQQAKANNDLDGINFGITGNGTWN